MGTPAPQAPPQPCPPGHHHSWTFSYSPAQHRSLSPSPVPTCSSLCIPSLIRSRVIAMPPEMSELTRDGSVHRNDIFSSLGSLSSV